MENKENLSRKQRKIKRKKEEIEKKQSDNKRLRYTVFTLIGLALFIFYLTSIPFNLVTKSQAKRTKDIAIIKPETKEEAIVKDLSLIHISEPTRRPG